MTRRLIAVLAGVTGVVLIALTIPLAVSFENQRTNVEATSLERDALRIGDLAEDQLETQQYSQMQAIVDDYQEQVGGRAVILDAAGNLLADSDPPPGTSPGRSFLSRPEVATALEGTASKLQRRSDTLDDTIFVVAAPVRSGNRILGVVRLSRSTHELDRAVLSYRRNLALIALSSLLGAAALGWVTARWATRPIRLLQQAAAELGSGQLQTRADETTGPPEVRDLATRFNAMAGELSRLLETSNEFAADVAHQLRTPITAIKLRTGVIRNLAVVDVGQLDALEADVERLQRTTEGLLALTRIEQLPSAPQIIDVTNVLEERAETWGSAADEASVQIIVDSVPGRLGTFDPSHLEQILDNLIDNAIGFAPAGTEIELSSTVDDGQTMVHISDHGPGIPDSLRSKATQRHWHGRRDGTGLGLAICARLCAHNGSRLDLDEAEGGGLRASFALTSNSRDVSDHQPK